MAKLTGAPEIDLKYRVSCPVHGSIRFYVQEGEQHNLHCPVNMCARPMRVSLNSEHGAEREMLKD